MGMTDTLKDAVEAKLEAGVSLYRMSMDCGFDKTGLNRWYKGERDLRLETADVLADYLGFDLVPRK